MYNHYDSCNNGALYHDGTPMILRCTKGPRLLIKDGYNCSETGDQNANDSDANWDTRDHYPVDGVQGLDDGWLYERVECTIRTHSTMPDKSTVVNGWHYSAGDTRWKLIDRARPKSRPTAQYNFPNSISLLYVLVRSYRIGPSIWRVFQQVVLLFASIPLLTPKSVWIRT